MYDPLSLDHIVRTRDHVRRFYRVAAAAVGLLALFVQPSLASAIPAATQEAEQAQSTPEGLFELRKRAEGGDASAQKQLADALASGNAVRRDAVEAASWYARAADQGDHEAQVKLAALYRTGTGVESDRVVALRWLTIASMLAQREEAELRTSREALARELTRDEATRAEVEARAWLERFERERQSARQSASKPLVAGSDAGVVLPRVIREVRPNYTAEALRRRIRGIVRVEAVVLADGTVGEVQVVRSLDRKYGLDQEAVKAARQWRFHPGTKNGVPVPVLVTIELEFQPDRR